MSDDSQRPIIIKRIKKGHGGAHGGAWKIAYADFVTAMMAFFLLMWLLSSATKATLMGIADFFKTPLKVALSGGSGTGDATSPIKGGGKDLTRSVGQVQMADQPDIKRTIILQGGAAAKPEIQEQKSEEEKKRLNDLKQKIEKLIESNPTLKQFKKQILLDITRDGLRIQIVDEKNRPMFDIGSAHLKDYTKVILDEIGKVLNDVPNRITLSGHTDATPYSGGETGYSNWELSSDRANASRRELVRAGMDETKILRVVGLASAIQFDKQDPYNPINRRISIIVMNKQAEEAALQESAAAPSPTPDAPSGTASPEKNVAPADKH
jgi:chemotaxis protein MotB